jgi:hypothetical protein
MREMSRRDYYLCLLNAVRGLEDDLDANQASDEAKRLLHELIAACEEDFIFRFGDLPSQ